MSGTTGPLVCGKCGKMLAINAEAGAAVCVLCGFSRPFQGTSCRFPRSPASHSRAAELAKREVTYHSTSDVRSSRAHRLRPPSHLWRTGLAAELRGGADVPGRLPRLLPADRGRLCARARDGAHPVTAAGGAVLPLLTPSLCQVDEKCISCGHKGLSFFCMQVWLR